MYGKKPWQQKNLENIFWDDHTGGVFHSGTIQSPSVTLMGLNDSCKDVNPIHLEFAGKPIIHNLWEHLKHIKFIVATKLQEDRFIDQRKFETWSEGKKKNKQANERTNQPGFSLSSHIARPP